ncbi:MAG: GtrA family protein [Candidatus Heimdallarchaeota archaeon]|nr:GtrA family protein [Candidatus Heimdallarchaeota archaeon]
MIPYLFISILATIIDFGTFVLVLNILNWHYLLANAISITFGILTKFSLNKIITFKNRKDNHWKTQFRRFITVSGTGFLLSNFVLYVSIEFILLDDLLAKIIAIGMVFVYTFILHNFYSFK